MPIVWDAEKRSPSTFMWAYAGKGPEKLEKTATNVPYLSRENTHKLSTFESVSSFETVCPLDKKSKAFSWRSKASSGFSLGKKGGGFENELTRKGGTLAPMSAVTEWAILTFSTIQRSIILNATYEISIQSATIPHTRTGGNADIGSLLSCPDQSPGSPLIDTGTQFISTRSSRIKCHSSTHKSSTEPDYS